MRRLLPQNCIEQEGYVRFLTRFLDAVQPYLPPPDASGTDSAGTAGFAAGTGKAISVQGLDFGCGPGDQVLATLLRRRGYRDVVTYDPMFAPDESAVQGEEVYDFITTTEVRACVRHRSNGGSGQSAR